MKYNIKDERELLKGRCIVVTGAASGLGKCTAYILAYQGAGVALFDLNLSQAEETKSIIEADFPDARVTVHKCDITDEDAVVGALSDVIAEHKDIDGLAQVAGMFGPGKEVQDTMLAAFEREMKVNGVGTFLMNKHLVKRFRQQTQNGRSIPEGGYSIVNIGSKASTAGNRESMAYTASKHSQLGISRVVAVEQAPHGIRCNCVCPGPVDTPLTRLGANVPMDAPIDSLNSRLNELGILNQILLKRLGQPEDVGHQVAYLLGPRAQFVTNTIFEVDGGWI